MASTVDVQKEEEAPGLEDEANAEEAMKKQQSIGYLQSLLGKTLRVRINDQRLFVGQFKCTDNECNIILANSHEYREPTLAAIRRAAAKAEANGDSKVRADMTSRFVGLIVVPGRLITKLELERFDPSLIK